MKTLLIRLALSLATLVVVLAVITAIAIQTMNVSRSDLQFLADLNRREGAGAVLSVIRQEIFGADTSGAADPSYGREQVAGRGNAPWVIRGNLDGRPRMILFALAPGLWAAWDTKTVSLYQVWEGGVRFDGAAYNYQHGPQPASEGAALIRNEGQTRWFLEVDGEERGAEVTWRGHEYSPDRGTAALHFTLEAGDNRLVLSQAPDVEVRDGSRFLTLDFATLEGDPGVVPGFYGPDGARHVATGTVELALGPTEPIAPTEGPTRGRDAEGSELDRGEAVIAGNACLSCHARDHRVTGPAWAQISGKYRGKIQDEVVGALTRSILRGSKGTWGPVPMPPQAGLSEDEVRDAVVYILSVGEPEENRDPPLDPSGQPYPATIAFDILPRLTSVHPSFRLDNVAPEGFEPKVGDMAFRDDGIMVLASWDLDGAVYLVDPSAPPETRVRRIAEGLHEPLGLTLVDDRIFVLQKQELTELIDLDGDGVIDRYEAVSFDWQANPNFHSFAFGLLHRDNAFYFLLSICVLPGGASCPEQFPSQGKLLRVGMDGSAQVYSSGYRTPNGIAFARDGGMYVTDNQGDYLPSSKLVRVREGDFYGSRAVPDEDLMSVAEEPPAVWLPQDEVGNSPTEPLELVEGPYAGQLIFGDVYNGGIKRVYLEEIEGREQGAVFHFSAGFSGSVNRLARGPDGSIYVGHTGNPPNWGEYGKSWFGLERLTWAGNEAFEILAMRVLEDGFELELTRPLAADIAPSPADLRVKQWFYRPDEQYGGPKYNEMTLSVADLALSEDRRTLRARIPGLREGHVVYLRLDERLRAEGDAALWTAEAWYTLNNIPGDPPPPAAGEWRNIFDGATLDGWRNYGGDADNVEKWRVENGELALVQSGPFPMWDLIKSVVFGGGSGDLIYYREKFRDFELSLEWKISENGNSGIFYLVADEEEKTPWLTGIEMQVLHNEGHADGHIETHRAGDLYDLIAADPETVRGPGEWNEVRIRIQDNRIEHWLNGVKVVEVTRASEHWNELVAASKFADMPRFGKSAEGYIVLQDHGDPVWYRNIRVRTLPPGGDGTE